MQKNKKKQTKGPLGGFLGYLLSITVSVIAVVYLGYHFVRSFGTELSTVYAMQVTENDVMEFDAYILRNETIIYANEVGGVGYDVSDGTKVQKGAKVASIYGTASESGTSVRNEIMEIDRELELLYESNNTKGFAISDTAVIDRRIDEYYKIIRSSVEQNEYNNLPKRRDELLPIIEKAVRNGTVITVCSQCPQGTVSLGAYETSSALKEAGAICGYDLTTEAAVAKLYYLFSCGFDSKKIKEMMEKDLRGEMSC